MPFGLRNAAWSFQQLIDEVLHGMHYTFAYIDDVLFAKADSIDKLVTKSEREEQQDYSN